MKKCPYCAEEIQDDAVFCRHCKSELFSSSSQQIRSSVKKPAIFKQIFEWHGIAMPVAAWLVMGTIILIASIPSFLIISKFWYILIPAIAIWYLWKKSKFSKRVKIAVSLVLLVVFSLLEGMIVYNGRTPTIIVTEPQNDLSVQAQSVMLKGKIIPSKSKVVINEKNTEVDKDGLFSYEMKLPDEQNVANIKATNGKNIATTSISIKRIFTAEEKAELDRQKAEVEAKKQAALEARNKAQAQAVAKTKAEQAAYENSKAGKLCKAHPTWIKEDCELIAKGKVHIGMTKEQAIAAWGNPGDINRTTSSFGVHEQWVYGSSYLYFEDGILTTVQN